MNAASLHYLQASTSAECCYDTNIWCLDAESYKMVQVFMVHVSHL